MLKLNKKAGFAAVAIMAMSMMALTAMAMAKVNPADEIVVATVNGDKIFKKDVLGAIKTLPVPSADTEKVFPVIVDQMINEKLIDGETAKAEIEKSAEFQARFAAMKAQLVKTVYLEKYLKDKITDKTVKAEYDKFKKENKGKEEVHARHILVLRKKPRRSLKNWMAAPSLRTWPRKNLPARPPRTAAMSASSPRGKSFLSSAMQPSI